MSLNGKWSDIFEIDRVNKTARYFWQDREQQPRSKIVCYIPGQSCETTTSTTQGVMILEVPGHENIDSREFNAPKYQLWLIYDSIDNYWRADEDSQFELRSCDLYSEYSISNQ